MIQLILTLKMTTTQVVETSVTVNNNSPIHDYVHPDDRPQPSYEHTKLLVKEENLPVPDDGLGHFKKFNVFAFCRSVDPSEALHMPGVRTYIGADDVPGSNRTGAVIYDEELFATEKVILLNKCLSYS